MHRNIKTCPHIILLKANKPEWSIKDEHSDSGAVQI